jgi:hypothetical protein
MRAAATGLGGIRQASPMCALGRRSNQLSKGAAGGLICSLFPIVLGFCNYRRNSGFICVHK